MKQKTTHPRIKEANQTEKWYVIDAEGKVLGKLASKLAMMLRGKHKPTWDPSVNCGDHVIVINAEKVVLTGAKEEKKQYIRHTGYPGAVKYQTPRKLRIEKPTRIIEMAVDGMIPRNRLRKHAMAKLHIYTGVEHPHSRQNPQAL